MASACSALDPAVVLLDQIVEPLPAPVPSEAPQLAIPLHLAQRARVALEPVGHDSAWIAGVVPAEGAVEEALGRLLVALGAEQGVDGLAGAVDGAVEVAPLPVDPEVGLVDGPRPTARAQVPPHPLLELRGEALDPAVHGRVVDLDPAIGQHALKVAVADRELQVPAHRPQDDLGREAEAAERPGVGHEQRSRIGGRWGNAAPTRLEAAAQRNGTLRRIDHRSPVLGRKHQVVEQDRDIMALVGIAAHPQRLRRKRRGMQPGAIQDRLSCTF